MKFNFYKAQYLAFDEELPHFFNEIIYRFHLFISTFIYEINLLVDFVKNSKTIVTNYEQKKNTFGSNHSGALFK